MIRSGRGHCGVPVTRREKEKANEDAMKVEAQKRREQRKSNRKYYYEHLCNAEIMKSYIALMLG